MSKRIFTVLLTTHLALACGNSEVTQSEKNSTQIPEPPIATNRNKNTAKAQRTPYPTTPEQDVRALEDWRKLVRTTSLKDLKATNLAPDDIEVRVWAIADLYVGKTKCYVFARKADVWSGSAVVDKEFRGKLETVKVQTLSDGGKRWNDFVTQNLSPEALKEAAKYDPDMSFDELTFVIEAKFGNLYERQFINNEDLLRPLFQNIKSEFFNSNEAKWREF